MLNIFPPDRLGALIEKNKQLAIAVMCVLCDHSTFPEYIKQAAPPPPTPHTFPPSHLPRNVLQTKNEFFAQTCHPLQLLLMPMSLPAIETACTLTQRVQLPPVFVEK